MFWVRVRHGTQALIAAFDVSSGKVEGVVGNRRTEAGFANLLDQPLASALTRISWRLVCDSL
jgi:hypothetical protein